KHLLDPAATPAERVTREKVAEYVEHLLALNRGYTVLCRLQELYDAIRVMAPQQDWGWLRRLGAAIRSRTVPARSKRERIQPPALRAELGTNLMSRAERAEDLTPLQRAVLYRDGLLIALLAFRPIRLSNLTAITIGSQLLTQGESYCLSFEPGEMKNRR